MILVNPIAAIITRIEKHCASGKILEGYKFVPVMTAEVIGKDQLPSVGIRMPTYGETMMGRVARGELTLGIVISVWRENGLADLMLAMSKVLDAIDTDPETGLVDTNLASMKPYTVTTEELAALDVSIAIQVNLHIEPKPFNRGDRA